MQMHCLGRAWEKEAPAPSIRLVKGSSPLFPLWSPPPTLPHSSEFDARGYFAKHSKRKTTFIEFEFID